MTTRKQYSHVSVTTCSLADIGHVRTQQQDSLGYVNLPTGQNKIALQRGNLYVVADGVASSQAGEQASRLAVETIIESYYTAPATKVEYCLKNAILRASQRIQTINHKHNTTTVVCAVIRGSMLYIAHVGDSRAYLLHAGKLKRLTVDHTVVQEKIDKQQLTEEEAKSHPERHTITRALGSHSYQPTIGSFHIEPQDVLLLCSDGLHGELSDEAIENLLIANTNLKTTCAALVEQANLSGGRDNISLIVTRVEAIEQVFDSHEEADLPPLPFRDINNFSYARVTSINARQQIKLRDINNFSDTTTQSVDSTASQETLSWWRRRLLGIFTIILVTLLIIQTIWFQNEYRSIERDLQSTQENFDRLILDYEQGNYGDVEAKLLQKLKDIEQKLEETFEQATPTEPSLMIPMPTVSPNTNSSNP